MMKKTYVIAAFLGAVFPLAGGLQAGEHPPLSSKEVVIEPAEDPWEFIFTPYGILPWVDLGLSGGTPIRLDPGNVWDALDMFAMFEAEVRKGRWGLSADVIYVDLSFNPDQRVIRNLEIKEWLIMPRLNYRAWEGNWGFIDLQAGVRSTSVDMTLSGDIPTIKAGTLLPGGPGLKGGDFSKSGSAQITDASFGLRGRYNITDQWHVGFSGELGAGDSDFIAQALGSVGYRFNDHADMYFGFRFLYYDFPTGFPLEDEIAYGPQMGLNIRF